MARSNYRGGTRRAPKDLNRRVKKKPCAMCLSHTDWVDYKDIGLLRRPKFRGRHKIEYTALLTFTGYNLVRMRNLLAPDFR